VTAMALKPYPSGTTPVSAGVSHVAFASLWERIRSTEFIERGW
jgi:hypothetical protein